MVPLQFAALSNLVWSVVHLLVALVVFAVVFGVARLALPEAFRRLAEREGWTANGEAVLLAGANGAAATLAAVLALSVGAVGGRHLGTVLVLGGVVTGVAVERRRRSRTSPVTELLALVAGLLAVGIAAFGTGSGLVRGVGVFLAGGAFGALGRAAVRSLAAPRDGNPESGDVTPADD
ncbi:hypothetical protein [Halorarum salinum]|uniref:Uncharacterized protein n=1 Tax=Halorarum salinum TaxID=2743089 RepID=A0A7D5QF86_9EURY|nr:hypothetical protein [Halobaculum salinum]QLG61202.1 hypothetical protein HUG12_05405 [Halobaculum salinum]